VVVAAGAAVDLFAKESPIVLSDQDRQRFVQALDDSPKPSPALQSLTAGKPWLGDEPSY
jgi:uncharacterized protein (DUF1778 family)